MSMLLLAESVGAALLVTGSLIIGIAGIGLVRLGDPFMRMHAATKAGVVGAGLVMLGAGIATGTISGALTGLAGLIFLFFTAPIASHVLGRAAYIAGAPITPSTVQDALAGVLPRNVHDIDPARTVRRPRVREGITKETAMTAVQLRSNPSPNANLLADPATVRRATAWLVGGQQQDEALQVAFSLARMSGASLSGLSAIDPGAGFKREPVPAGGIYWASRLASVRRQRMRDQAAEALASFERLSAETGVKVSARHEEGPLDQINIALAGADLVVTPAGVGQLGTPAAFKDEVATIAASTQIAPVLRVNRQPRTAGHVALLIDDGPRSKTLAKAFAQSGVYPYAEVTLIPLGQNMAEKLADEQADLLDAHGRRVTVGSPLSLSDSVGAMQERFLPFEMVAMTTLSARGGWFSQLREDAHEVAADTAPMTLLL